jgi:hypothetical protein
MNYGKAFGIVAGIGVGVVGYYIWGMIQAVSGLAR